MTSEQCSYLAGLVDGEGSIAISQRRPKGCINIAYSDYIKICNTDLRMLEWSKRIVGKGTINSCNNPNRKRTLYVWTVHSLEAEDFLKKIYKYLVIKKEQADIFFIYRDTYYNRYFQAGTPKNILKIRENCFHELKKLHN